MGGYLALLSLLLLTTSSWLITCNANMEHNFLSCMAAHKELLYTRESKNYNDRFFESVQNWRKFNYSTTPKPAFIFVPHHENEIQALILCCKKNGFQIRVKSNGHDYEALSLLAQEPYVVCDLYNRRRIDIDVNKEEAWVETGATLGELYYSISLKSNVLSFPAGACPSVGVGGHISGGGWGWLVRKYGLAADNVLDARLIDVNGRILTRQTMGEDLFWAIRGSGGASFGVITSWKLKLVRVPPVVTWGKVMTYNQTALDQFYKWQNVAPTLPKDLYLGVLIKTQNNSFKTVFRITYLGPISELLPLMHEKFPELGLTRADCKEADWIDILHMNTEYGGLKNDTFAAKRVGASRYKGKSDYVQTPIPKEVVFKIWEKFLNEKEEEGVNRMMFIYTQGGRMDEISSDAIPFPHRKGNLYGIEYLIKWPAEITTGIERHYKWINDLYKFMEPYVSKNPRGAYINYKDLDIGQNNPNGNTSYHEAKVWGEKYFRGNFERLAKVKSQVDPENFFRNEQSIPLFK